MCGVIEDCSMLSAVVFSVLQFDADRAKKRQPRMLSCQGLVMFGVG